METLNESRCLGIDPNQNEFSKKCSRMLLGYVTGAILNFSDIYVFSYFALDTSNVAHRCFIGHLKYFSENRHIGNRVFACFSTDCHFL